MTLGCAGDYEVWRDEGGGGVEWVVHWGGGGLRGMG